MNKPFYGVASMPKSERSDIIDWKAVPGPGSYDTNKEKIHNDLPKWSLMKRIDHGSCFQDLSISPGPGKYQYNEGFKKQAEQIISTKGQKYRTFIEKSYSHSNLNLPGCLNHKGGFSFGYREPFRELEKSPGPVYHLNLIAQQKRSEKNSTNLKGFGTQQKNTSNKIDSTPSPASFNQEPKNAWKNKTCESWTFGTGKRAESQPPTNLGPGQYNPKVSSSFNRTFKLRGRNEVKGYQASALGPGAYNIPDTKTKLGTKFSHPKKDFEKYEDTQAQDDNLSPFSYSPPRYLDKETNGGYSLGKKIEQQNYTSSEEPGPGSYEIARKYEKGQCGYMGRKVELKKKENLSMQNFYKYDPNLNSVAKGSPKFSFPQGRKCNKENGHSNSYSQEFHQSVESKPSGYHYSMGTSKRFVDLKKEGGPYKDSQADYSSTGQLPSYLKKCSKKK